MGGRVVHCRQEAFDVYVGRRMEGLVWTHASIWGNPFYWPGRRAQSIERYRQWIVEQPALVARLPELRGKVLGCWCKPGLCHGDVLVSLANPPESSDLTRLMHALLDPDLA